MIDSAALTPDAWVLLLALGIDLAFGDPPNAVHPVAWLGRAVGLLQKGLPRRGPVKQFVGGAVLTVVVVATAGGMAALLVLALERSVLPAGIEMVAGALLLKSTFAIRGLGRAASRVAERLRAGDLDGARLALGHLCSRDPSSLNSSEVAAAAVESVAENSSDSIVAPLFFYLLLGLPGAAMYRAANTLDAMIGYHGRFEYLGKFAARLDDVLNWVPARLTAGLLLLAGLAKGANVRGGIRILRRDGGVTESPNAGRPMAAMAGMLDVALEKRGHYRLGDARALPSDVHITSAWRIARGGALAAGAAAVTLVLVRTRQGW